MNKKSRFAKRFDPGEFYEVVTLHIANGIGNGLSPHPTYVAGPTLFVKSVPMYKEVNEEDTQVSDNMIKLVTRSYVLIDPKITRAMYQGLMYDVKEAQEIVPKRHISITLKLRS